MIEKLFSRLAGKPAKVNRLFIPTVIFFGAAARWAVGEDPSIAMTSDLMLGGFIVILGAIVVASMVNVGQEENEG